MLLVGGWMLIRRRRRRAAKEKESEKAVKDEDPYLQHRGAELSSAGLSELHSDARVGELDQDAGPMPELGGKEEGLSSGRSTPSTPSSPDRAKKHEIYEME